jgi:hypothetical protein
VTGFCSAGVSPAILRRVVIGTIAGETLALHSACYFIFASAMR